MTMLTDFERDANRLRWHAAGAAFLLSALAFGLFAAACRLWPHGMPWARPVPLWVGTQFLLVAARSVLAGSAGLPQAARDGAAQRFALLSAFVVGLWIGFQRVSWTTLLVLPLYAAIENPVRGFLIPSPDDSYVPVPVTRWVGYVTLGQLAGFLLAGIAHALLRRG
jgi:hypothetical protein